MPRTPRRRIAEGVYVDRYSLTAVVTVGSGEKRRSREQAFPADATMEEIQKWRARTRVELLDEQPLARKGTLAGDADAYLKRMDTRPISKPAKASELKAWSKRLGTKSRHLIKPADIDAAIAAWLADGVAPKTIVNRCRTLHHLYVTLANDRRARTPLDNITLPNVPKRRPAFVGAATIKQVEKRLRKGDALVHAFFMVIASTGLRNAQVNRVMQTLTAADVRRRLVLVEGGKGGEAIPLVLNADQHAAFTKLLQARVARATPGPGPAYKVMDASKYARAVREAGWPEGVRPYNARHAIGIELAERGIEDGYIQAQLGHSDLKMIRQHYTGVRLSKMARISQALEGRLGWGRAPSDTPTAGGRKRGKSADLFGKSQKRKTA